MPEGTMTADLPLSDTVAVLIGNAIPGGVTTTVRILIEKLSAQLAASGPLAERIVGAEAGLVETTTWAQLAAIAGTRAGQVGQAIGPDAGTHTDPVVGGTVANKGRYSWSVSPAGWRRTGDYISVSEEIAAIIAGAPGALDTLNELAAALGDDPNFATTIINALALKAPLASPALSGTPTAPTAALGTDTTQIATTAGVRNEIEEQATAYQPGYDTDDPGPFEVVGPDGYVRESPVRAEEYDTDDAARIAVVGLDGYVVTDVDDTPAIMPATVINEQAIRRSRQKLRMILRGATEQCRIAVIGDSYVNAQLPTWIRARLVSIYGDAGPGFVSFVDASNVKCANSAVTVASTGTWTSASSGKATPRLGSESSSDTGAYKTVFGSGAITSAYLHFIAAGGATGFYRWGVYDGSGSTTDRTNYVFGSDHSLDLSTGYRISMPTDAPASGTWALEIGCSAGTMEIAGADLKNSAAGVIVDSLGVGGSSTTTWLAVDGETWRTAVGSMGIDAVFILLGTNDQAGAVSDEGIAHNFASIRHRILIALPAADVAFVSPPENFLERDRKMPDITSAVRTVAANIGATHIDLQPVFGPITSKGDYQSIGVRPLFNADDVHPETGVGDVVIADTIERLLLQ